MGQDPEVIRREIEQTRERMGETVEALGYKADVPSRAKDAVSDRVTSVKEKITGATSSVGDTITGATDTMNERTPSAGDVKQAARKGAGIAQENPLGLAIGSVAIGFLAGMLIPSTRVENEKIGPMADQVKDQAMQTGQQALEHGKHIAQDVAGTAQESLQQVKEDVKSTAQESAQEHGDRFQRDAQENAQAVRDEVSSS
jgi:gas vesicle protein